MKVFAITIERTTAAPYLDKVFLDKGSAMRYIFEKINQESDPKSRQFTYENSQHWYTRNASYYLDEKEVIE